MEERSTVIINEDDSMDIDDEQINIDFDNFQLLPNVITMLQSISNSDKDGAVRSVSF